MADLTPYGFSGQGIVAPERFPQMQNPYGVAAPQQPQEQAPQSGLFDSHPFHDYLMQNAKKDLGKNPWDLTDEDINKGFENYMGENGPISTIIGHDEAMHNRRGSGTSIDDHVKRVLAYHKLMGQSELQQQLPQLKAYLQSQKPAPVPGQQQAQETDPLEALSSGAQRAFYERARDLGLATAGAVKAGAELPAVSGAAALARMLGLKVPQTEDIQNALFSGVQKAGEAEAALPEATTTAGKIAEFAGALPLGLIPTSGSGAASRIEQGKSLGSAEAQQVLDTAANLAGLKAAGIKGNTLKRVLAGAGVGGGASATGQLATTGKVDPLATALATGAGGVGGLVPVKEGGVNAKGGEAKTATGEKPAKAPVQEGKPVDTSGKAGVAPTELSEQSQGILSDALDTIYKSKDPAEARALHDQLLASVPEDERPAFTDAFANDWAEAHGTKPEDLGFGKEQPTSEEADLAKQATEEPPKPAQPEQPIPAKEAPQVASQNPEPPLPRDLRGSKPRYGNTKLDFASDFDKALYTVGKADTLSARDHDFMSYISGLHPNLSLQQIRNLGKQMREHVKNTVRNSDEETVTIPKMGWSKATELNAAEGARLARENKPRVRYNPLSKKVEPISPKAPSR